LQAKATNLTDYLHSLEMICSIRPFDPEGRARIAQLINKSNQFNLTTRRYTEAEIAAVESESSKYARQMQLADRFGNNGMISVIIADIAADTWSIDTWLMSCRVLGRRVEEAVLADLAEAAIMAGASRLRGYYYPTSKNRMVAQHYAKLGFSRIDTTNNGGTVWELDLEKYSPPNLEMQIARAANPFRGLAAIERAPQPATEPSERLEWAGGVSTRSA
jgi:FkbH-like protein